MLGGSWMRDRNTRHRTLSLWQSLQCVITCWDVSFMVRCSCSVHLMPKLLVLVHMDGATFQTGRILSIHCRETPESWWPCCKGSSTRRMPCMSMPTKATHLTNVRMGLPRWCERDSDVLLNHALEYGKSFLTRWKNGPGLRWLLMQSSQTWGQCCHFGDKLLLLLRVDGPTKFFHVR